MDNSISPSTSPSPQPQTHPKPPEMSMPSSISSILEDPINASPLIDWSDFLDFNLDVEPFSSAPFNAVEQQETTPGSPSDSEDLGRVRKRDPRLVCANFLAGRVPCACPELDEKLEQEEEMALGGPGKKRARKVRVPAGSAARCQVQGCEADISELKGYHKRHRVCLQCANASAVVLDGQSKRYCQQCGKFHILSDFDEGKRSCRRKLERHNDRRRRKPTDGKETVQKEHQQISVAEDVSCDDTGKDSTGMSSENTEKETFLESEGQVSTLCSANDSQNIQRNSTVTSATFGDTQVDGGKENPKYGHSPSYCDNKSAFSSVCPTGRISFKLYDWNPAEFPRRLRLQIFQWLASMPVELEGYIRPGCTILTVFIPMPKFMWVKLSEEPAECLHKLVVSPGSLLSGRDTFFVYLNNMIFRVIKGGNSVFKVKVKDQAPKLHYIHPTCFEAGKPMEFVACGSNLQSNPRFLISFMGKYLSHDFYVSSLCGKTEGDAGSLNHELLKISVPQTEPDLFGPAFVEVENEFGLSNFIPVLIGDKEICAEMKIMQQRFDASLCTKGPELAATSSCEVSVSRHTEFSEFMVDVAWSLRKPVLETKQYLTSAQIKRSNNLLAFLIKNESIVILDRVVYYVKLLIDNNIVAADIADADMELFWMNLDEARDVLHQKLQGKEHLVKYSRKFVVGRSSFRRSSMDHMASIVPSNNQGLEVKDKPKLEAKVGLASLEGGTSVPLLSGDVVMHVNISEQPGRSCSPLVTKTVFTTRPLIFAVAVATVCFGVCAVIFHPEKVGEVATTIRKCLLENS